MLHSARGWREGEKEGPHLPSPRRSVMDQKVEARVWPSCWRCGSYSQTPSYCAATTCCAASSIGRAGEVVCAQENFIPFYFFCKSRLTSRHFADALSFML